MTKVIFTLDGVNVEVQCSQDELMRDICQRFVIKIKNNINSLVFLYGGKKVNMELKFKEQINSFDKERNEMKILVYQNESNELTCPKCGEKIRLNIEQINNIILSNDKIKDSIIGIKIQLENILNNNTSINFINLQLKNITILLNTINEDIQKNNEKIKNLLYDNNNNAVNNDIQIKIYNFGKYEGQLINNKREGRGKFYWNCGDIYEGEWKNDMKDGKGIYYCNNTNRYEGDFKNDKAEGKGIFYYNDGSRYEGDWKNDMREGKGIAFFNNGNRYEGDFKNGLREGKGIYYYNDGSRYEGDWKNDQREGKGVCYLNNGDRYEGDFKNDKAEGKGIYYYINGDREMGDYFRDQRIYKHVGLRANGDIVTNFY